MERKIGEIFEYNGEWYQCVEGNDCANCNFIDYCKSHSKEERDSAIGLCVSFDRSDGTHVVFKKLEKVGEPYPNADKLYQLYKLPMNIEKLPPHTEGINLVRFDIVEIEIKQNKEDMEETSLPKEDNPLTRVVYAYVNGKISDKELIRSIKEMSDEYPYNKNNLKPFSLELARQSKPVCTRDGRKAIFLTTLSNKNFPVVAIVSCGQEENVYQYDINGVCDEHDDNYDLMMLPEKKTGWINIYPKNYSTNGRLAETGNIVYPTKESAVDNALHNCIATISIEWEE